MQLLRADLLSLCNLPRDQNGRRLAVHLVFGLGLLAFLSWWIASTLLARPQLFPLVQLRGSDSLLGMIGMGLLPCPIAATWLGLSLAQRQLFDSPELPLWESAPQPRWRGPLQILLRACFLAVVWAAALSAPFVCSVLANSSSTPPLAYALVPVAIVTATVPLMASLLVVQIALVRLFAGRALRMILTALGAIASVGFSIWLLLVLFTGGERTDRLVEVASTPDSLPWTVAAAARFLTSAANGTLDLEALRHAIWWLLLAAVLFWIGARLHARALEAHRLAEPTLRRHSRAWPSGIAATFRRKEIAQLLQQPGALVGFLVFAALVFVLIEKQVLVGSILANRRLPIEVCQLAAMLAQWFLATVLVLYPHMGRLVLWDSTQWSLYQTAPASMLAVLRGKLEAIGLLLLWPLLLVGAIGAHSNGAAPLTILLFFAIAVPGMLIALGVLAFVGTLPWLVRPEEGRGTAQGGRNFFASLLLITIFELALSPAFVVWWQVSSWAQRNHLSIETVHRWLPTVLGSVWAAGLLALTLGLAIGGRNFRRLTMPR